MLILLSVVLSGGQAAADGVEVAGLERELHPGMKDAPPVSLVTEHYEYYDIRGRSEQELRGQMCRNGCEVNGETYDSVTSWRWDLHYGYDRSGGTCAVDSLRVALDIRYRYPRWVRSGEFPQALIDKWDGYMKHLVEHEKGHRDLAVDAASELARAVAVMPPAHTCAELDRTVTELERQRMKKLNSDEQNYDDMTGHGKKQGAVFP